MSKQDVDIFMKYQNWTMPAVHIQFNIWRSFIQFFKFVFCFNTYFFVVICFYIFWDRFFQIFSLACFVTVVDKYWLVELFIVYNF